MQCSSLQAVFLPCNMKLNKVEIYAFCLNFLDQKIADLKSQIDQVNEAASGETKSSAGDKHETARAMMHIERDNLSRQLLENMKLKTELGLVKPEVACAQISMGALVDTNNGVFFLATSIGKVELKGESCYVLSKDSPIAKAMWAKQADDEVDFRAIKYKIKAVY
ncbi:MAG: transcription elongation GreA/GreB family factor [Limisphaerales bacterium]